MKIFQIAIAGVLAAALYCAPPASAEDQVTVTGGGGLHTGFILNGARQSSKFQEYRDITDRGAAGSLEVRSEGERYFDLKANQIGLEDQSLDMNYGKYGSYKLKLSYDQIPHRFAYDAKTLYSGIGTGDLLIAATIQSNIQNSSQYLTGSANTIAVARDISAYMAGAHAVDLGLLRKKVGLSFELPSVETPLLGPLDLKITANQENRKGTRPFFAPFGFGNTIEVGEPIDYDTTEVKITAERSGKNSFWSAGYTGSLFRNNIDNLVWSNPFRAVDGTSYSAYSMSTATGAARGRMTLYPDNQSHALSLAWSKGGLPWQGRISALASAGMMLQNEKLQPYTSNTAVRAGTFYDATSPTPDYNAPFDAFDAANLPTSRVNGKVYTYTGNLTASAKPLDFMDVKTRYRYYGYINKTGVIDFPGYVRLDGPWYNHAVANEANGYEKHTAGLDLGFNVIKNTRLGVVYDFENTLRGHGREVANQNEHTTGLTVDNKLSRFAEWKASYRKSVRRGNYDYAAPFEKDTVAPNGMVVTEQLPWLRKYDEADRNRDRAQFMVTLYPTESLTVAGSAMYGQDDFKNSSFGLLYDRHQVYSMDADYNFSERLAGYAFFNHERFKNKMKARQWSPGTTCVVDADTTSGECTDPYYSVTAYESPSNWEAKGQDVANTIGGGLRAAVVPDKLDFDVTYSYARSDGKINMASEVGANIDVDPHNYVLLNFTEVDDTKVHTLNAKAKYSLWKNLSFTLGWLWEKFDINDFNNDAPLVPVSATGAYQGALLMGTLAKSYDVNVTYAKLAWKF